MVAPICRVGVGKSFVIIAAQSGDSVRARRMNSKYSEACINAGLHIQS